jgi:N,N'-diacetyllegionaminate synthase
MQIKKPFIIAEIGNNHEGSFHRAKKLVVEAAKAGVSAVKFQTFQAEYYINKTDKKRFKRLKKYELTKKNFIYLSELSRDLNLKFISTPFDLDSASFLSKIVDIFKISSGDNNYYDLIKQISGFGKKVIISLGLANMKEVLMLVKFLSKINLKKNSILMHCVSSYPVLNEEANLNSINFLKNKLKMNIGYSDHTIGLMAPIVAYCFGATIIEKHFTLDYNQSSFRDHKLSLNPKDMKKLVISLNQVNEMIGDYNKTISNNEKKNILSMRRSYYANQNINRNQIITFDKIKFVRPAVKNSLDLISILNKKVKKKIFANKIILARDLF